MLPTNPCNLCDSTSATPVAQRDRRGNPLQTVVCTTCGLGRVDPRPTAEQLREYYASSYRQDLKGVFRPKPKHVYRAAYLATERARRVQPFITPGGRLLDFGAGGGEAVYVFRSMGYDAQGVEPHEGYADFARRELGVPVRQGFYQDLASEDMRLDAVTMFHVLEHLDDPTHALQVVRSWLRPGGRLVVEVPDLNTPAQFRHTRFFPAHLYHFSRVTLPALARKVGFAVIEVHTTAHDRHLLAVLERRGAQAGPTELCFPEHAKEVTRFLKGHNPWMHMLSYHPYARPLRKVAERWREYRQTNRLLTARDTLEFVIQEQLGDLVPAAAMNFTRAA